MKVRECLERFCNDSGGGIDTWMQIVKGSIKEDLWASSCFRLSFVCLLLPCYFGPGATNQSRFRPANFSNRVNLPTMEKIKKPFIDNGSLEKFGAIVTHQNDCKTSRPYVNIASHSLGIMNHREHLSTYTRRVIPKPSLCAYYHRYTESHHFRRRVPPMMQQSHRPA